MTIGQHVAFKFADKGVVFHNCGLSFKAMGIMYIDSYIHTCTKLPAYVFFSRELSHLHKFLNV